MTYRILSLERIDGDSLPTPLRAGFARWKATVEFWDGEARGAAHLVDDFVFERPTQIMRPKGGDDWELSPKEESLKEWLTDLIERMEPHYLEQIRTGVRGFRGDTAEDQHGTIKPDDPIAHHAKVRELLGKVKVRPAQGGR